MILAIDMDKNIHLFSSEEQVYKQIEAIDVENGEYEFCNEHGRRFFGEITTPVTTFKSGLFRLVAGEVDATLLNVFISGARALSQGTSEISTLDELREYFNC